MERACDGLIAQAPRDSPLRRRRPASPHCCSATSNISVTANVAPRLMPDVRTRPPLATSGPPDHGSACSPCTTRPVRGDQSDPRSRWAVERVGPHARRHPPAPDPTGSPRPKARPPPCARPAYSMTEVSMHRGDPTGAGPDGAAARSLPGRRHVAQNRKEIRLQSRSGGCASTWIDPRHRIVPTDRYTVPDAGGREQCHRFSAYTADRSEHVSEHHCPAPGSTTRHQAFSGQPALARRGGFRLMAVGTIKDFWQETPAI